MAYQTFRVEITRDETRDGGPVGIEITAYLDRMPETNEATVGRLSRARRGVWNSRLPYTGDFATFAEALAATVSTKGQVILPKTIRQRRNWTAGTRLVVEDTPDGVLLKPAPVFAPTLPEDVAGMLAYPGPPRTVEEMDAAITAEIKRRHA